jgi:hypothetical protein
MQNGTAAGENSMAIPQKVKNRITTGSTVSVVGIYPK